MRNEPSCETSLAAELALSVLPRYRKVTTPYRAAVLATELCSLGRRWAALQVRLCNEPDPTGAVDKRRESVRKKIEVLLKESPYAAILDVDGGGMYLQVHTPWGGKWANTTLHTPSHVTTLR